MTEADLFGAYPANELTNDELRQILVSAVRAGIHGHREADLALASVCADHILNRLRLAGVAIRRA